MSSLEQMENLIQLKDLEYICSLARLYLKDSQGTWPIRIERYISILKHRIAELEDEDN